MSDPLTGLRGAPLRTVAGSGLTALVFSVPADDFGTDEFTERMADLAEPEALARTHHEVVEWPARSGTRWPR
ncbi:GvpL/GvpF family gas vesicle protein [Streptomyces sp. BP-8]|uniref:GvpL/GvpF family gas vesicle protein n=1 Tax=Streptomyces sirii TaxID=3127701 RepID=A0ABZ2QF79_9ACTN